MRRSYVYFSKRPRLPLLSVYAAQSILASSERQIVLRQRLEALVQQAEIELVTMCCRYALGASQLTYAPHLVDEAIERCYATGFPCGQAAYHSVLDLAEEIPNLPRTDLAPQNLHMQTIAALQHFAVGRTLTRLEQLRPDSLWAEDDWDEYFSFFPNDEFRIPVLVAARSLAQYRPEIFIGNGRALFSLFFKQPRLGILQKQTWQEADRQQRDEEAAGLT